MREIKFRAWDSDIKCMLTVDSMPDLAIKFNGVVIDKGYPFTSQIKPCEGLNLMQYTGLKDKNGKEIYEGDIVKQSFDDGDLFAQVVWSENDNAQIDEFISGGGMIEVVASQDVSRNTGFITLGIKDIPNYPLAFNPFYVKNAEVIGNIYENKELLND